VRGDDNSAISGLNQSLDIGGFEKAYVLFGVRGVKGNIFDLWWMELKLNLN
jgi:hypothetical protein